MNSIPSFRIFRFFLLLLFLFIGGCATLTHESEGESEAELARPDELPGMQLVALDFVQAFMQVDPLMERSLPILLQDPYSVFGEALGNALVAVGITLASPDTRRAVLPASHSVAFLDDLENSPLQVVVRASFDEIEIQRTYRIESDVLVPNSAFFIRGYDPRDMLISNDLFSLEYTEALSLLVGRLKQKRRALAERLPGTG